MKSSHTRLLTGTKGGDKAAKDGRDRDTWQP